MSVYKDETELLQAALRGENEAFGLIVEKYQSLICAITLGATNNLEKSEDLAQQVFVNAWQNLQQLRDLTKFRNWLCTIAHNVVNHALRDQKRDLLGRAIPMHENMGAASQDHQPDEAVSLQEQQAIVTSALSHLSEEYRQVLVLFYREEKSVKTVAEQLAISEDAVRTRLSRGREMLKDRIETMVEKTLRHTKPGKAFTAAVMGGIVGLSVAGPASAAVAKAAVGHSTITAGLTAKIVAAAAVVAVGISALVAYNYFAPNPVEPAVNVQEQEEEPEEIAEPVEQPEERPTNPLAAATQDVAPPVSEQAIAVEPNTIRALQPDSSPVVGGFIQTEDGMPIPGANVQLYWEIKRNMPMLDGIDTVSDANGQWTCKVSRKASDIFIQLMHPDYYPLFFDYRPSPDQLAAQTAVLIMKKGAQVSGYVSDMAGSPVPGALIMPRDSITSTNAEYGIRDSAQTARTDFAGNFVLNGVKPGHQDIAIDANGYGPTFVDVNVTPDMAPLAITLDEGKTLAGVVVDVNGLPISGVSIKSDGWQFMLRDGTTDLGCKDFKMLRRQTRTDAAGRFSIEHLPSIGEVDISVGKRRNFLFSSLKIDMAQNEPQTIVMYPIPTITGTVIDDASEKPIAEFEVLGGSRWDPNSPGSWDLMADKITSPRGAFSMTKDNFMSNSVSPGFVAAMIEAKGYLAAQTEWMRVDEKFSPVIVRLKRAQAVSATLLDTDGTPLANSDVFMILPSSMAHIRNGRLAENVVGSARATQKTDSKGRFELTALAESSTILVLSPNGYLLTGTSQLEDKLTLIPWAHVTGAVDNEEGGNSNIAVQVASPADPNSQIRWFSEQTTNADGSFAFACIPAIPQNTYYGPSDGSYRLNKGPDVSPYPGERIELRLGHSQPGDSSGMILIDYRQ